MLKPLGDRVLIKVIDDEKKSKGGIILSDMDESSIKYADVIEIGSNKIEDGKEVRMQVKKGDRVIISKYSGTEIKYNDEDYLIVKQEEILAMVE